VEWKEINGVLLAFDIRGTEFIIYRYTDPFRNDDAWAYVPTLRACAGSRSKPSMDSLLGTDHTLDDFYGYAGRTLETDWKFLVGKTFSAYAIRPKCTTISTAQWHKS